MNFRMHLKAVAKDEQVRVVVLTGAGNAFCLGQDLKAASGQEKRSFMESLQKRYNPIIADRLAAAMKEKPRGTSNLRRKVAPAKSSSARKPPSRKAGG